MTFFKNWVCFFLLFLLLGLCKIFANDKDSTKIRIGILPVVFYSPETRIGAGGLLYSYFNTSRKDTFTRKSSVQLYVDFTINKQLLVQSDYLIFFPRNKFHFKGSIDYKHFPEFYYGIGNDTKEGVRRLIEFNLIDISPKFYKKIIKDIYVGLMFQHQNLYMLNETLFNYNSLREIHGNMGYKTTGVGLGMLLDKRNNQLNPEHGHYLEVNFLKYVNYISMVSGFNTFVVDMRFYKTFLRKLVWNVNGYSSLNRGDVPFRMMPFLGGPRFLRGYYRGRFRDNNLIVLQHELRYPVFRRLGIAFFSGVGQVAQYLDDFNFNQFHFNYGAGLRFKIDRKENTNVRIDFGFTKDSHGIYIVFAEAF